VHIVYFSTDQLSRLHMILKPFMLRRVKRDVENELSDKVCIVNFFIVHVLCFCSSLYSLLCFFTSYQIKTCIINVPHKVEPVWFVWIAVKK